jgi:hypothetical protein
VVFRWRNLESAGEAPTFLCRVGAAASRLNTFDRRRHRAFQCGGAISGCEAEVGEKGPVDRRHGSISPGLNPVGPSGRAGLRRSRIFDVMDDSEEQVGLISLVGIEVACRGPGITDLGGSQDRIDLQFSTGGGIIALRGGSVSMIGDVVSTVGSGVTLISQAHDVVRKVTFGHDSAPQDCTSSLSMVNSA